MDADFFQNDPFRSPQRRADRVLQLVTHRKGPLRPRRFDDSFVRIYRRFLLEYLAAGDDEDKLHAVIAERPHVYWAHMAQYGPDSERRDILQALLLTTEPLSKIAQQFAMDEASVEFYEKVFFDVRDRLEARGWIAKVVLQTSRLMAPSHYGITREEQRGLVYKFFAFYGGPLVLDAVIAGLAHTTIPQRSEDVEKWLDDSVAQSIRSRAAAAALFMEINKDNVVRLLKMAFRAKEVTRKSKAAAPFTQADREKKAGEILEALQRNASLWRSLGAPVDNVSEPLDPVERPTGPQSPTTTQETMAEIELGTDLFDPAEIENNPVEPPTGQQSAATPQQTMAEIELGTDLFDPAEIEADSAQPPTGQRSSAAISQTIAEMALDRDLPISPDNEAEAADESRLEALAL